MGLGKIFGGMGRAKKYLAMSTQDLKNLDNEELRDAISERMMKEAGRLEVKQCLEYFTGAKRVFYIVSLYEAEVSTDSLCRFLVGPGRSAAPHILGALTEIHASRHADLVRKFTDKNGIDLNDLSDLEIESSWDYEERKSRFPFDEFDEKFRALYDKESINSRLIQYVRNHIDQF